MKVFNEINENENKKFKLVTIEKKDFDLKDDCHKIKNDNLKFIPQIELKFNQVKEIIPELINSLKKALISIISDQEISII